MLSLPRGISIEELRARESVGDPGRPSASLIGAGIPGETVPAVAFLQQRGIWPRNLVSVVSIYGH